ncbi:MAG TPA: ABC transporter ATP-binding protein [Thermodesulfobacteriota bacterium]|nr:ABC transporter ATP-binding protein [Thermodesulfobacteriota bacterium]
MTAHIRLVDVTKRFGEVTAVDRLNLEIEKGECFSLLGPSGCGKTTTLRMIAGFEDLDEGEIVVGGRVFSSSRTRQYLPPEKRDFGMVFQAFAVWPHLNVFRNVAFPLEVKKLPRAEVSERTRRALTYTGLLKHENTYPHELSGGEKQRIALARAIAVNPTVMLLDEPLSNLDPKLREEMRFEIKDLQKRFGFTVIYVTHDQAEAMALSDRMLVMSNGAVQQVDTPLNIYHHPVNPFVFGFIGLSNFIPAEALDGKICVAGAPECGAICESIPQEVRGRHITAACRPTDIDIVPDGGVKGVVKRKNYLGGIIDYRVAVGAMEVRVQKNRRDCAFEEGSRCGLRFSRLLWFAKSPP